jgi:N-acetylneuraminic acid mutarotase
MRICQTYFPAMLKYRTLCIIALLSLSLLSAAQSWSRLADYPGTGRDDGAVFTIANKAYCLTGMQVGYSCTRDGSTFDATTLTWSAMAPLPVANERQYAAAFSANAKGYLFGGRDCAGHSLKDVWQYDPGLDSWIKKSPMPAKGRCAVSCFLLNNKAYMVGGLDSTNTVLNQVWEYDPLVDAWTQKANLPFSGCWRGCGFAIDTSGYICYGLQAGNTFLRTIYRYSASTDTWLKLSSLGLGPRYYSGCAVVGQKACLYGGIDSLGSMHNDLIVFDPLPNSLYTLPGLPAPAYARKGIMAFALLNRFFLSTGIDTSLTRVRETWESTSPTLVFEESMSLPGLSVFPNPSSGLIHIATDSKENTSLTLCLRDAQGKVLHTQRIPAGGAKLNLADLGIQPGLYFIELRNAENRIGVAKSIYQAN